MDLNKVDVIDFLDTLGIRNINNKGTEVIFSCPFDGHRNGDINPSASMNSENTTFYCFGCKRKGNAVSFLSEYEGIPIILASRFLEEKYGGPNNKNFILEEHFNMIFNKTKKEKKTYKEVVLQDEVNLPFMKALMINKRPYEYLLNRGVTERSIEIFGIGYDPYSDRVTIPITNEHSQLVGLKARSITDDNLPKYLVIGDRGKKSHKYGFGTFNVGNYLFNLDGALATSQEEKVDFIVTEGEFSAIALHQYGYRNVVSLLGSAFTTRQRDLLLKYARSVTVFSDNDGAGEKCKNGIIKGIYNHVPVKFVVYDKDEIRDAAELSKEECINLIQNAVTPIENLIK